MTEVVPSLPAGRPRPWIRPALAAACIGAALWSGLGTDDLGVWAFEVLPLGLLLVLLAATTTRYRLSDLLYGLLTVAFLVQCLGGRYTFSEVPLPDVLMETFGLQRNPIDRVGHVLQGVVTAVFVRELLLRRSPLGPGWTLRLLVVASSLAFSALYELLEMGVVIVFYPDAGPEWLGMQGDPWDAQWDMTMALGGAIAVQALAGRAHDRAIARVTGTGADGAGRIG